MPAPRRHPAPLPDVKYCVPTLTADEGQEVLVDRVGLGGEHAMREAGVELQRGILQELGLEQGSPFVGNDLIVVPYITSVGTSILFRSSVRSVSENALMPS
jgi:hypothetical protein